MNRPDDPASAQTVAAERANAVALRARVPELFVALVLLVLAVLVVTDSLRVGHGWASDGPRAGYFPFFIGLGLGAVAVALAAQQLLAWKNDERVFLERQPARDVWAMLWPLTACVAGVAMLGLYLPSWLLIAYFMRRHGRFSWVKSLAVPSAFMVAVYLVFERWFLVPLPKGPLVEPVLAWLGRWVGS